MAARQQEDERMDRQTTRPQANAALIERAEMLVREVEFDMDRAARYWRRENIDIRAATAKLSAAQEAEARRCFEDDLREADLYVAEAQHSQMSTPATSAPMNSLMSAPRQSDAPMAPRGTAPRGMRNLV